MMDNNNKDSNIDKLLKRVDSAFSSSERSNNEMLWDELSEFMLNNQHSFFKTNAASTTDISNLISSSAGQRKTRRLYDSTALQAVQDLASAFQSTLTNPATIWSKLRYQDDRLNNDEEAIQWLEQVNKKIHLELAESNFDTEISKSYQSLVALNNMAFFQEADTDENGIFQGFRFTSLHLSQMAWSENKDGIVDTLYRKFTMTARQAFEKWGMAVSDKMLKILNENPDKELDFVHVIFPRDKEEVKLNDVGLAAGVNRPFASIYIDLTHKHKLEESGYYEFPVHVTRWSLAPGEKYGRGPSLYALPNVRTINKLMEEYLIAVARDNNPPVLVSSRDVMGNLNLGPKGLSVVRDVNGVRELVSSARMDRVFDVLNRLETSIKSIFFIDKLQPLGTLEKKERMSQFEVTKRLEEMQSVLGPVLSRLNSEFLQPLVIRAFKILLRSNSLPPIPDIIRELGLDIEIVFVNQLARSQQIQDVTTIQQWVQNMGQLAQIDPSVLDNINSDGIAKHSAQILGVPEIAIRNADEVESMRKQRAEAEQQMMEMQQAQQGAEIASKLPTGE